MLKHGKTEFLVPPRFSAVLPGAYVLVSFLLFLINISASPDILWFYWPLFGWGIGIVMHAVYVFGFGHWFGPDWEEKKITEIMDQTQTL